MPEREESPMKTGIEKAQLVRAPKAAVVGIGAGGNMLRFYNLNKMTEWRYRSLYTKEPETIDWLNRIRPGEVLWDVGANVGIYTVYAAARGARVLAFEPLASNYYVLNMNIELNDLASRARAFCLAFAEHSGCDVLNVLNSKAGMAQCSFEEAINDAGAQFTPKFKQGMIGYSIDEFVARFNPEFPNHMKVDVDGIEERIIAGAPKTLRDPRLKTLSIELNGDRTEAVDHVKLAVEQAGFVLVRQDRTSSLYPKSPIRNFQFSRPST